MNMSWTPRTTGALVLVLIAAFAGPAGAARASSSSNEDFFRAQVKLLKKKIAQLEEKLTEAEVLVDEFSAKAKKLEVELAATKDQARDNAAESVLAESREVSRLREANAALKEDVKELRYENAKLYNEMAAYRKAEQEKRDAEQARLAGSRPFGEEMAVGDRGRIPEGAIVQQILNPTRALVRWGDVVVVVEGPPTSGTADGQKVRTQNVFTITGTWSYETAGNSVRTVFVLEPAARSKPHAAAGSPTP